VFIKATTTKTKVLIKNLPVEKARPLFFHTTAKVENLSKIPTNIVTPNRKIGRK